MSNSSCPSNTCPENYLPSNIQYNATIGIGVCNQNSFYWLAPAALQGSGWRRSDCNNSLDCSNLFNNASAGNLYTPAIFDTGKNFTEYTLLINKVNSPQGYTGIANYGDTIQISLFSNNYVLAAEYKNAFPCNLQGVAVYQFVWTDASTLSDPTLAQFVITSFGNTVPNGSPVSFGDSIVLQCVGNPQTSFDPCSFANGLCARNICTTGQTCNYLNYGFTSTLDRCVGSTPFTPITFPYLGPTPSVGLFIYYLGQTSTGWVPSLLCYSTNLCQTTPCPIDVCPNGDGLCPSGVAPDCILNFNGTVEFNCPTTPPPPPSPSPTPTPNNNTTTNYEWYGLFSLLGIALIAAAIYFVYRYHREKQKQIAMGPIPAVPAQKNP